MAETLLGFWIHREREREREREGVFGFRLGYVGDSGGFQEKGMRLATQGTLIRSCEHFIIKK
jgi:hypothetical protein